VGKSGRVEGMGGGFKLPFRQNRTSYVLEKLPMAPKPYYKAKQVSW